MLSITQSNVLCFPHIEFPDATWLKGALCIWDHVYRIVPAGYTPRDSDEVLAAIDSGAVKDLRLSVEDLAQTRRTFSEFLARKETLPHAIDPKGDATARLHTGKIDEQLVREFDQVVGHVHRRDEWLEMPKGVANGYMLYLAQTVSKRRCMPKITDSDAMFVAMQYFANKRDFKEATHDLAGSDACAAVVLRTILPGGLEYAPMDRVLGFRGATVDGRQAFRAAFQSLVEELAEVEEVSHVPEITRQFEARLLEAEGTTLPRIKEYFTDCSSLMLQVGLPVTATGVAALLQSDQGLAVVGKVLVQLVGAFVGSFAGKRKEWRSAEATYLARLNQEFDGDRPFPKRLIATDRLMDEFLND